jgi:dephospho-CoA kinase
VSLVALTGGIGSGKSTVAALLAARGAVIVDADEAARLVVEPGEPALGALVERFGHAILRPDGSLDREVLARVAFASDDARRTLEAITHPAIRAEMDRRIAAAPAGSVVVCDVPLMVEAPQRPPRGYDAVLVVEAPVAERLERLEARGMDRDDAARRVAAQATDEERRAVATHVIENSEGLAELEARVDAVWAELVAAGK